jgi:hypothetical protein
MLVGAFFQWCQIHEENTAMESSEILEKVRASSTLPQGWVILPLSRRDVIISMLGWATGILLGFGLFAAMAISTIPHNYHYGIIPALITTIFLVFFLFVGCGSLWSLFLDARRLIQADKHVIVITLDTFVKREGNTIINVPLMHVQHVTARGAPPPDRSANSAENTLNPSMAENVLSLFAGRGMTSSGMRWRLKRMRTPTTLAFVDSRTESEVLVVDDKSHGDPFMIAALLKQYVASAQSIA